MQLIVSLPIFITLDRKNFRFGILDDKSKILSSSPWINPRDNPKSKIQNPKSKID
jgi:hypothetical protein